MRVNLQVVKQSVKWVVYSLLLVNFVLYIVRDWSAASHILTEASRLMDWLRVYATTGDYAAWLILIMLFELETYILSDEAFTPLVSTLMRGIRLICYLSILHTVYAYGVNVWQSYYQVQPVPEISDLCQVVDSDLAFVNNQKYVDVDADNCAQLGTGEAYFLLDKGEVIVDRENLEREAWLAWLDLAEAIAWLIILVMVESIIRLQDRGITSSAFITGGNYVKLASYGLIIVIAIHWSMTGLYLYAWDEALWIGGFAAIEMNISDWRAALEDSRNTAAAA